jgi:hypothetical protein
VTGGGATAQTRCQQTTGMPLEDQERVIHVLVVGSIEEAELLLSAGGIVGGIDVEQDFAALPNLLSAEAYEGVEPAIVSAQMSSRAGGVFSQMELFGAGALAEPARRGTWEGKRTALG